MLYLASQSPRRRALLEQIAVAHELLAVDVDETPLPGEAPARFVRRMALAKARAGGAARPGHAVLGADTAVVLGDRILGKPQDGGDAVRMLLALAGREHRVLTGVAVVSPAGEGYRLSDSRVRFRPIDETEARAYCATGEPLDKAGAYAIQGLGAVFVQRLSGSYSGVVGLPLFETAELLGELGLGPAKMEK